MAMEVRELRQTTDQVSTALQALASLPDAISQLGQRISVLADQQAAGADAPRRDGRRAHAGGRAPSPASLPAASLDETYDNEPQDGDDWAGPQLPETTSSAAAAAGGAGSGRRARSHRRRPDVGDDSDLRDASPRSGRQASRKNRVSSGDRDGTGSFDDVEADQGSEAADEERARLLASGVPVKLDGQVSMWTGTWNVGAKDPFAKVGNPAEDMAAAERVLNEFVPTGYDIYVLSVQEGVSDKLFSAIAAYTDTYRLPLYAKLFPAKENHEMTAVRSRRMARAVLVQDFIEQEEAGSKPEPSAQADMLDRVWGRGDGAFLRPKFTGMAVFVRRSAAPYVRLLGVYKHSFGASEGSKGGVGVALGVYNQTIAFIGAHMASKRTDMRRAQYEAIVEKLGAKLGGRGFQLTEEFHHVIWMGDLNYHCSGKGLTSDKALTLLRNGRVAQLLEEHDELLAEREEGKVFYDFEEPTMTRDFLPTYKKIPGRGVVDYNDPEWPDRVYEYAFKEEWYKGGRTVDRIPSWTDRIMFHSLPATDGLLQPELCDADDPDSGHNYRPVNDGLDLSDHSPVFCTWTLGIALDEVPKEQLAALKAVAVGHGQASAAAAASAAMAGADADEEDDGRFHGVDELHPTLRPLTVGLRVSRVRVSYRGRMRQPRAMSLLFPLPYEDGDEIPERAKVLRQGAAVTTGPRADPFRELVAEWTETVSRANKLPDLHLLLKVSLDDGTKPQAVISLGECGVDSTGSWKVTKFVPLMRNGLRAVTSGPRGAPVDLQFTLEAQVRFAGDDHIMAQKLLRLPSPAAGGGGGGGGGGSGRRWGGDSGRGLGGGGSSRRPMGQGGSFRQASGRSAGSRGGGGGHGLTFDSGSSAGEEEELEFDESDFEEEEEEEEEEEGAGEERLQARRRAGR